MSAWIVTKEHIDLLVAAAEGMDGVEPDALGQMLWEENHKSVNYRYGEKRKTPRYKFTPRPNKAISPVVVLKQIACLGYQSCEHASWDNSKAAMFLTNLTAKMLTKLTPLSHDEVRELPEYEAAPWGIKD